MPKSRIIPPVYFFGALALALVLHHAVPLAPVIPAPWHLAGAVLIAAGLGFVVLPAHAFRVRGTAIRPFEESSVLVQDGFFALSRNPMYLGMVLVVLGVATLLRGWLPFIAPVLLVAILQMRFIRFEEQMLESRFGEEYRSYKARVRRWL